MMVLKLAAALKTHSKVRALCTSYSDSCCQLKILRQQDKDGSMRCNLKIKNYYTLWLQEQYFKKAKQLETVLKWGNVHICEYISKYCISINTRKSR